MEENLEELVELRDKYFGQMNIVVDWQESLSYKVDNSDDSE